MIAGDIIKKSIDTTTHQIVKTATQQVVLFSRLREEKKRRKADGVYRNRKRKIFMPSKTMVAATVSVTGRSKAEVKVEDTYITPP